MLCVRLDLFVFLVGVVVVVGDVGFLGVDTFYFFRKFTAFYMTDEYPCIANGIS